MSAREPLPVQYLGVPGATFECVKAMVTILTSGYPCREITVVYEDDRSKNYQIVCFVVWEWMRTEVTIVPDGFGTHGGTGTWGLAVVLELIQFYGVPIREKWVDTEQFERIADGYPTESDLEALRQADMGAPSWPMELRSYGSGLWRALGNVMPEQFPYWLLEPELLTDVKGLEQDPAVAVFRTVRRLEILIRGMGPFEASLVGQDLISRALGGKSGQFPLMGSTDSEAQAWEQLFRGAIGAFKNPHSHRDVKLSVQDAAGQIFAVNMLLRKLKKDHPDKFTRTKTNLESTPVENDDDEVAEEGGDLSQEAGPPQ